MPALVSLGGRKLRGSGGEARQIEPALGLVARLKARIAAPSSSGVSPNSCLSRELASARTGRAGVACQTAGERHVRSSTFCRNRCFQTLSGRRHPSRWGRSAVCGRGTRLLGGLPRRPAADARRPRSDGRPGVRRGGGAGGRRDLGRDRQSPSGARLRQGRGQARQDRCDRCGRDRPLCRSGSA